MEKVRQRLDKKLAGLMVKALPEGQREEMILRKCLTTLGILTTLQVSYQPGGLGQKKNSFEELRGTSRTLVPQRKEAILRK